ncbi:MAG: hypothetical protein Rubg2KO_16140 [Rubricoccaceae bacterium]
MSSRTGLAIAMVGLLASSGCMSLEMTRLRNHIDRGVPEAEIGKGFAVSFGFLTMGTARTVLALSDDGDESTAMARALLRNVRKVKIGRYHVNGRVALTDIESPPIFDAYEERGWIPVVTIRETDELVWVMAKEKRDDLRDLLVVVLSDDELVLAKMSGNLTEAVTAAMAESDWASQFARSLRTPPDSVSLESHTTTEMFLP